MTTRQAQVPATVARYFGTTPGGAGSGSRAAAEHPVITQAFHPGRGWKTYGFRKRISGAWARKMAAEGYTAVALTAGGRTADFTLAEILKAGRQ